MGERDAAQLREDVELIDGRVATLTSTPYNIANEVKESDLVIGAVLIPGAKAPKLVTEAMIAGKGEGEMWASRKCRH